MDGNTIINFHYNRYNKTTVMITILIGISGSGKTTLAKEMISKNKNLVRINRDDLRASQNGES